MPRADLANFLGTYTTYSPYRCVAIRSVWHVDRLSRSYYDGAMTEPSTPNSDSILAYSTSSPPEKHPRHLQVITSKWVPTKPCPTVIPEPHLLGEFPMTCYRCHLEADS